MTQSRTKCKAEKKNVGNIIRNIKRLKVEKRMAKTNEGITGDQCLKNEVDGDKEID